MCAAWKAPDIANGGEYKGCYGKSAQHRTPVRQEGNATAYSRSSMTGLGADSQSLKGEFDQILIRLMTKH